MDSVQAEKVTVVPHVKLETVFCMKGGKGETSYAHNSQAQARHSRSMVHLLQEALNAIQIPSSDGPFAIADLGCSSGENTLFIIDVIIKHLTKMYVALGKNPPEFLAFFSDLPSNDFNTLFQLLPPPALDDCPHASGPRSYYAAGVPGTFYRRLFPEKSIDVFHSAFSLHWLSQVPESVTDENSPAYNKGRIFVHGASMHTAAAYKQQFQKDLESFLSLRALELRKGGSMFLAFLGRTSLDPTNQGGPGLAFGTHFNDAWNDLVEEGLIDSAVRDKFNIPLYAASLEDVKEVLESMGSFAIKRLEIIKGGSPLVMKRPDDLTEVGRALVNTCRSVGGVLVEAHIGERLADELFDRLERRATDNAVELLENLHFYHIVASLSLI